ncbi:MAG TPA: DUF6035 family protein [Hyphomonadaceae bacterium]|nr:DUF6035 family protein [Hyphomonadaceae bacterium]
MMTTPIERATPGREAREVNRENHVPQAFGAPVPAHQQSNPFVLDRESGAWIDLRTFLGDSDYGDVVSKRMALRLSLAEGVARYVCPRCGEPMTLASVPVRVREPTRFYFKHRYETGECSGTSGLGERAICALKFNHQKEGWEHKRFKERLLESLAADPAFSDTKAETRFVDAGGQRWRQPDVQTNAGGQRIAFEAQLSTTFIHVIAERMKFYAQNDAALVWLFRDLNINDFRQAEDDIFYANNRNVFRLTDETVALTKAESRFALECVWLEPIPDAGHVRDIERRSVVYFSELQFDVAASGAPRAFYFNYDAERAKAILHAADIDLRQRFEAHWLESVSDQTAWLLLRKELHERGIEVPEWSSLDGFQQLLDMLYSVKHWKVIGSRHRSMVEKAHYLHDRRKGFLLLFHHALKAFGRVDAFKQEDVGKNRFSVKVEAYRAKLRNDPTYAFDGRYVDLAMLLFPEIPTKAFR